jgi:hypothetical protein
MGSERPYKLTSAGQLVIAGSQRQPAEVPTPPEGELTAGAEESSHCGVFPGQTVRRPQLYIFYILL